MIDMLKGKKDLGTICAMIMLATNNQQISNVLFNSVAKANVLANFYDIGGLFVFHFAT